MEAYKQTNIGSVLGRMKHLDNIVIKQGLFPKSLDGLEDSFVFFSIEVDFENLIYESLKNSRQRLREGMMLVHDRN